MSLPPGHKLAHYEILEPIGKGGMGEVYRAKDSMLGREVAIKVLPEEFARDKERLDRFEREARLLAQLNHANIATLHGLEEHDGQKFLVMELVEGETLAERIAKGPIPIDEAIPLFIQIAEGLEAAHEKAIIHRDLKPANIKIGPDRKPKILDFGLAKAFAREDSTSSQTESPTVTRHTEAGVILGTAPYMSPEQARGKSVDKRTDIWAFGCCLYEALTGKAAFLGQTVSDTIAAILKNEPNWSLLPVDTPTMLRHLLRRCLQKEPAHRQRDMGDARIAIEEIVSDATEPVTTAPDGGRNVWLIAVAALLTGILGALIVSNLSRPDAPSSRRVSRTVIPFSSGEVLQNQRAPSLAISPNGRFLAYITHKDGLSRLYQRAVDELEPKPIDGATGAGMPFFSPDSEWLGFFANGELRKVSVTGGAPVTIAEVEPNYRGASWGSDGTIVFTTRNTNLSRVAAAGGEPEVVSIPNHGRRERAHRFPEVLPGGKAVVFTLSTGDISSWDDALIAVLSLETGEYRVLLEGGRSARYSPSGHLVYARAGSLLAVPFELETLEVTGAPVPVIEGVMMSYNDGHVEFSLSADGSLLYAPGDSWGDDRRVVWVERDGRSQTLIETSRGFAWLRLSPDERWLVLGEDTANVSLHLYDIARGTLTRFVSGFSNSHPVWAPDGGRVAFGSDRDGNLDPYWQAVDGASPAERLTDTEEREPALTYQLPWSWSPDGKTLALWESRAGTGYDIGTLSLGGQPTPRSFLQTASNEGRPVFSPDGGWIAYESDESGQLEIYIRPFPGPGRTWRVSIGGGTNPVWNPLGRELFYQSGDYLSGDSVVAGRIMAVDIDTGETVSLGTPRMLFEGGSFVGQYDVTRDGLRFVMIENNESFARPTHLVLVLNWFDELERLVPTDN